MQRWKKEREYNALQVSSATLRIQHLWINDTDIADRKFSLHHVLLLCVDRTLDPSLTSVTLRSLSPKTGVTPVIFGIRNLGRRLKSTDNRAHQNTNRRQQRAELSLPIFGFNSSSAGHTDAKQHNTYTFFPFKSIK